MHKKVDGALASRSYVLRLARAEAASIRAYAPDLCSAFPVRTDQIANRLGIVIKWSQALRGRAHLERSRPSEFTQYGIQLSREVPLAVRRFAIAHEIGHALLLSAHPNLARTWKGQQREWFANAFAADLVMPPELRSDLVLRFQNTVTPDELLRFTGELGLTPAAFFRIAREDVTWMENSRIVWLRVKFGVNQHTGRDPKLRIIAALYDQSKYFIAVNSSLGRFVNEDWLRGSLPGSLIEKADQPLTVSVARIDRKPKFRLEQLTGDLYGMKLNPSRHDQVPYYLLSADLRSDPVEPTGDADEQLLLPLG